MTTPAGGRPRPPRPPRLRAVAAVGLVVLIVVSAVPVQAGAQEAGVQTLTAGQEVTLAVPGVTLMTPGDGRLAGYGFETTITGVAFASRAGGGTGPVVAAAGGDQLVVIAAAEKDIDQSGFYGYGQAAPAYSVTAGDGPPIVLPSNTGLDGGTMTMLVAVDIPAGAPAIFTASRAGFSQAFDLRAGHRSGVSPAALYRDRTGPAVSVDLSATQTVTGTGSGYDPATMTISPQAATLGYFQPATTIAAPPAADRAWLIINMDPTSGVTDSSGPLLDFAGVITGPSVQLDTPAGPVNPIELNGPDAAGPFPDLYAFAVPATLSSATFVFNLAGPLPGTDAGTPVTLDFKSAVARFPIALPAIPAPLPQGYIAPAAHHTATTGASATPEPARSHHSRSDSTVAVLIVIAAVLLAAVIAVAAVNRRKRLLPVLHPTPIVRPPGMLLAGHRGLLEAARPDDPDDPGDSGVPLALGPGPTNDPVGEEEVYPEPVLVDDRAPAGNASTALLVVSVLGPLQVQGLAKAIRRRAVTRLLVTLAVVDGPLSVERLRDLTATDPDRPEPAQGIHSWASKLRACLPPGLLPPIGAGQGGYQLGSGVEVDWQVFHTLARHAREASGPEQVRIGLDALSLVRGTPLAYGAWEGIATQLRVIETAIENLAVDVARWALAGRDARAAETAIGCGLKAVEGSPVLWETRLAAAAAGSGVGLERCWADCRKALDADASPLEATYQRLRAGDY